VAGTVALPIVHVGGRLASIKGHPCTAYGYAVLWRRVRPQPTVRCACFAPPIQRLTRRVFLTLRFRECQFNSEGSGASMPGSMQIGVHAGMDAPRRVRLPLRGSSE